jgi:lysozyme
MKISQKGLELIEYFEGCKLTPYRDCVGLWTCCIGHLIGNGSHLPDDWNRTFTLEEAYALLAKDVARFERGVERYCPNKLTQSCFDALVSFSFNLGLGTLQRSSLRQKINRQDYRGAAKVILKYNKAGGVVKRGLTLRRQAEALALQK